MCILINCIEYNCKFLFNLEFLGVWFRCSTARPRWRWSGRSCKWHPGGRGGALLGCNSDIEQPLEEDASEGRYQEIGSIEDMGFAPQVWVFQGVPPDSIDQLMLCDEVQVSGEEKKYSVCTQSHPVPNQALSDHYGAHSHLP